MEVTIASQKKKKSLNTSDLQGFLLTAYLTPAKQNSQVPKMPLACSPLNSPARMPFSTPTWKDRR